MFIHIDIVDETHNVTRSAAANYLARARQFARAMTESLGKGDWDAAVLEYFLNPIAEAKRQTMETRNEIEQCQQEMIQVEKSGVSAEEVRAKQVGGTVVEVAR